MGIPPESADVVPMIDSCTSAPNVGILVSVSVSIVMVDVAVSLARMLVTQRVITVAVTDLISTVLLLLRVFVISAFILAVQPSAMKLPPGSDLVIVAGVASAYTRLVVVVGTVSGKAVWSNQSVNPVVEPRSPLHPDHPDCPDQPLRLDQPETPD